MASPCSSHNRVEPSMSVNRNVTVPAGISPTGSTLPVELLGHPDSNEWGHACSHVYAHRPSPSRATGS
jgi:hypothetical protein